MVLRLHGMEEVGVRFPVGPHADVAQWQSNPFVRERLEVQLLSSAQQDTANNSDLAWYYNYNA
jgi:hypothetical protein